MGHTTTPQKKRKTKPPLKAYIASSAAALPFGARTLWRFRFDSTKMLICAARDAADGIVDVSLSRSLGRSCARMCKMLFIRFWFCFLESSVGCFHELSNDENRV